MATYTGTSGNDLLRAISGSNLLTGEDGDDTLIGGESNYGNDTLG
jgi:Ca2+-binding RTX toxin-like protein